MLANIITMYILPHLVEWVVTGAVTYGSYLLHKWTGINVEAKRREALQSALRNAAIRALDDITGNLDTSKALEYVRTSVPDTLDYFKLEDFDIERLLSPHVDAVRKMLHGKTGLF